MKWLSIVLLLCGISFAQEDRQAVITVSCGQILDYIYPKLDSLSDVDSTKLNRINADLEVCAEYGQLAPATPVPPCKVNTHDRLRFGHSRPSGT